MPDDVVIEWLEGGTYIGKRQTYPKRYISGTIQVGKEVLVSWRKKKWRAKIVAVGSRWSKGAPPCSASASKEKPAANELSSSDDESSYVDSGGCSSGDMSEDEPEQVPSDSGGDDSDDDVPLAQIPAPGALASPDLQQPPGAEEVPAPEGASARKRGRNPAGWAKHRRKEAYNKGLPHMNTAGKQAAARAAPVEQPLCQGQCKLRCSERITDDERQQVFEYYRSKTRHEQHILLFSCLHKQEIKRQRAQFAQKRSCFYEYYITINQEPQRVCRNALCKLFGISHKVVENVRKKNSGPQPIKSGKHGNQNKLPDELVTAVKQHIESFPSEASHYSRTVNANRRYLSPSLTIAKMHRLFMEDHPESQVTLHAYRDIFAENYNLGFGSPKSDTCTTCDAGGDAVEEHKRAAKLAMATLSADRATAAASDDTVFITFDLQKTLPLPKLSVSIAFYLRQLWLYNLGVHVVTKGLSGGGDGYMFTWTENQAGRGCEEIISGLLSLSEMPEIGGTKLVAWSDSCAGQNKNQYVYYFWQYLIHTGRFTCIDHKFPEVGHSMLDSDRDFAKIEQRVRREETVYLPSEYHTLMRDARHKPTPFKVILA